MVGAKNLNFLVLFYAFILCSLIPRFCRAQGNTNPCDASGTCGPFGICNPQGSPTCTCLKGFYPLNSGNWSSGCARRAPLNCEANGGNQDGFLKYRMMQISGYSEIWFPPKFQCQDRCLSNCSCLAYGYDANVGCVFWNGNLTDIQYFSSGSSSDLYIRVSSSELGDFIYTIFLNTFD